MLEASTIHLRSGLERGLGSVYLLKRSAGANTIDQSTEMHTFAHISRDLYSELFLSPGFRQHFTLTST